MDYMNWVFKLLAFLLFCSLWHIRIVFDSWQDCAALEAGFMNIKIILVKYKRSEVSIIFYFFMASWKLRIVFDSCHQISNRPWKQIGKIKWPLKVSCFVWLLAREAALTLDVSLIRRIKMLNMKGNSRDSPPPLSSLYIHKPVVESYPEPQRY